ncbi:MAG: phosphoribosylglycinamide formyltransferase [Gemmatimonadetes bacterium]|nr:phosphoribosylglycinamide formyltransferase [Gemmatimonadota bacterium]
MVEPLHVAVLASGSGSNLQAVLDQCRPPAPADVVLVASNRPDAGSFARAERAGVPTYTITDPDDADALLAALRQAGAGFVVLAGYLKLLPEPVVDAFAERMVNIHPALLPAFGGQGMYGMRVHRAVLASGATVTGPTVHLVTNEYDRGPILAQWPVPVRPTDTPEALRDRVLAAEHELLPAVVLAAARAGRAVPLPVRGTAFAAGTHMPALQDQLEISNEPDK